MAALYRWPAWQRRLVTVPAVFVLFVLATLLLPLFFLLGLLVDAWRWLTKRVPWVASRIVVAFWVYLSAEVIALSVVAVSWLLTGFGRARERLAVFTYWAQALWASYLVRVFRFLFRLGLEIDDQDVARPGRAIYMFRHASLVDTLLPLNLVSRPFGIRLRYVLKNELLVDPALDIAGNLIPNHFVDRRSVRSTAEIAKVGKLADDLTVDQGVLIYPEGTRYTEERRTRAMAALERRDPEAFELAQGYRHVLPPRPGGPLALLDAGTDVVFCAHAGLDGFARVADIWRGGIVGTTIRAKFWRVAADLVPRSRSERKVWLFAQWQAVDDWIAAVRAG